MIPIIDLFAGPGGLGEGFSSFEDKSKGAFPFQIGLSIEKDQFAHRTLKLRAFFRQFGKKPPDEYYKYIAKKISPDDLKKKYSGEWASADQEAICAELGNSAYQPLIDKKISAAVKKEGFWVLIGGPPCQAYSLVGRSRMQNAEDYKRKQGHSFDEDHRHQLYRQYLRIIANHSPAIFVMENVKGILSAKVNGEKIFPKILADLQNPSLAAKANGWTQKKIKKYKILSLVTGQEPEEGKESDFLIRCEDYGIPQARHRVILLGIREDVYKKTKAKIPALRKTDSVSVSNIIKNLPKLRSGFSKGKDDPKRWNSFFHTISEQNWCCNLDSHFQTIVQQKCAEILKSSLERKHIKKGLFAPNQYKEWFTDKKLLFIPNHETRSHMDSDLERYLFVSAYGMAHKASPHLKDFPVELLPSHKNVQKNSTNQKFSDRFKVQLWKKPSSTITSHISKDGHYFIHPDPAQCRSLTVREAARLQTFPDNYFFEGNRTQQYHQVGNAVPPLLARQLAEIVYEILNLCS